MTRVEMSVFGNTLAEIKTALSEKINEFFGKEPDDPFGMDALRTEYVSVHELPAPTGELIGGKYIANIAFTAA